MYTDSYTTPQCEVIEIHAAQIIAASDFSLDGGGSLDDIFGGVE